MPYIDSDLRHDLHVHFGCVVLAIGTKAIEDGMEVCLELAGTEIIRSGVQTVILCRILCEYFQAREVLVDGYVGKISLTLRRSVWYTPPALCCSNTTPPIQPGFHLLSYCTA